MAHPALEVCENCHRSIGSLETPRIFSDRVVCPECYSRLTAQPVSTIPPIAVRQTPSRDPFLDPTSNAQTGRTLVRVFFWIIAAVIILALLSQIQWANDFNGRR